MDSESYTNDALEIVLNDPNAKPCDLSLDYLRYITNDFSRERELGRGGFGVVYKGVLRNGEMVAVKNLLPTLQFQEKQFKYEIDNLMRVRNENIVRFLGYCYETRHEYIEHNGECIFAAKPKMLLCFEYVPNGSLNKYISEESHGLDWQERYKIIMGICHGLYYLHNECQINGSVIHLDMKPENILLDDNMVPKIADFGLAKLLDDGKTHACATELMGTLYYMAPEYSYGRIISRQADIYSLGLISIQIITGHRVNPFDNVSLHQDFVELAVKKWRDRLEAAPSETDCKQIKRCLEIGLSCIKVDRNERPTISEIIKMLSIRESTDCCARQEEMTSASLQISDIPLRARSFTLEWRPGTIPAGSTGLFIVAVISRIISSPQSTGNERGQRSRRTADGRWSSRFRFFAVMYKSRLQELCMKRRWQKPEYSKTQEGPDHSPVFRATVNVNGEFFCSPVEGAPSAKAAESLSAKAAFEWLAAIPPSSKLLSGTQIPYKNQLQIYAQRRGKQLPSYQCIQEGPSHAPQFKSVVTIDGETFESPQYCHALREAEAAAAEVALKSLPQEPIPPQKSWIPSLPYKNLLQEMIQKQGIPLPVFITTPHVSNYSSGFKSTVEIEGITFEGEPSNTRKKAELSAAKVAYQHFEESDEVIVFRSRG